MRLFAFLFLAAFLVSGLIRYSRAAAPPSLPVQVAGEVQQPAPVAPIAGTVTPASAPTVSLATAQPAPQVLRHKRRFARAALRTIQKMPGKEPPLPPRRMAKLVKSTSR